MDARSWFAAATEGFREILPLLHGARLEAPALGSWDVRSLLGHTCRAYLTIETYLRASSTPTASEKILTSAEEYFRAARSALADAEQVARRGREAGLALGDDPASSAAVISDRVSQLVHDIADEAWAATPLGAMRLREYLPTRAFEVTVHSIDLALALESPIPASLVEAAEPTVILCARLAEPRDRLTIARTLTGRTELPAGFSVL